HRRFVLYNAPLPTTRGAVQSNSRDLHDDMPPALSNRPSDDARPLGALHALRHPGQLLPAAVALLLLMACGGEEHEHAARQNSASDGAPVVMVADSPAETAGVALLPHTPVADGAVGIGVAHDPSKMGMKFVSQGVSLAIEHLNSRGSAYRFAARTSSPGVTSAVQSATELRNDTGVLGVVGHSESGPSLNAIPVYEDVEHDGEHAVVAVSPTATSPRLSGHSRWFFRVCPNDLAASAAVARFALDSLEARRAAVIYRNDSYGRDWTAAFAETFTQGGGEVVQRAPYLAGMPVPGQRGVRRTGHTRHAPQRTGDSIHWRRCGQRPGSQPSRVRRRTLHRLVRCERRLFTRCNRVHSGVPAGVRRGS